MDNVKLESYTSLNAIKRAKEERLKIVIKTAQKGQ